ncbi:MAG: hypothetical protein MR265_03945 [Erysipelotrichaceae bacterium]|nr:hypothetical protein [Erysipelotrichaceae bacterium]
MNDIFEMLLNKYNTAISNRVDALAKKELIESLPAKASFDKLNEQFLYFFILALKPNILVKDLIEDFKGINFNSYLHSELLESIVKNRFNNRTKKTYEIISKYLNTDEIRAYFEFVTFITKDESTIPNIIKLDSSDDYSNVRSKVSSAIAKSLKVIQNNLDLQERIFNSFETFMKEFKDIEKSPFINVPKEVINSLNEKELYQLYLFLSKMQKERLNSSKITKNNSIEEEIENLLNRYNLSLTLFNNKDLIIKRNIKELEEILKALDKGKINFSNFNEQDFFNILVYGNIKDIKYIFTLYESKIINEEFIYLNPNIFLNENSNIPNSLFNKLVNNFRLLESLNLTYDNYYDNQILLLDHEMLILNIQLLKTYMKKFSNKNLWCSLIINPSLFKLIDFFIENGVDYSKLSFTNLNNYQQIELLIKKIFIALNCNIMFIKNNMIDIGILNTIKDEEIDNYVVSETNYNIPVDILDEFKKTKTIGINYGVENLVKFDEFLNSHDGNMYFGNNIIISKNKFLRNLTILINLENYSLDELIFYALIYDSFLSDKDIKLIKSNLKHEK